MYHTKTIESYLLPAVSKHYQLEGFEIIPVEAHEGGRNKIYIYHSSQKDDVVLRISNLSDRTKEDYEAELEYVHYLHAHGACVADVIPSIQKHLFEEIHISEEIYYICLFQRAKGKLLVENNYRYREGTSIHEYFYHCGKVLGQIHRLSKEYTPNHHRYSFFDHYQEAYINKIIPCGHQALKNKFHAILNGLRCLKQSKATYGMLHFDFGDSNYSIDFETGDITVYDFDNCCMGFYLYDLLTCGHMALDGFNLKHMHPSEKTSWTITSSLF